MSLLDVIIAGIVLVPVAFATLFALGWAGVGPLARTDERAADADSAVPPNVSLRPGETVEYATDPKRGRWKLCVAGGILLAPFVWGVALVVYGLRVRKRPQYIVTDERIIEARPDRTESYDYERVSQVQTGAEVLESLAGRGHVTFSVDERQLISLTWMSDPEALVGVISRYA